MRNLREASTRLLEVIWKSKNMIILLIIYYILFGWVAYRMFAGTSQGNSIFRTREESSWNMMIVFAGSSFLVRILPSYNSSRLTGIMFLVFNIVGFLFFMNVTLAILYNQYLAQVNQRMTNFKSTVDSLLTSIFRKHCESGKYLTYAQASKAIDEVRNTKTRGEYDNLKTETIIKIMDKKKKGLVKYNKFLELFDIMFLLKNHTDEHKSMARKTNLLKITWRSRIHDVYHHKFYEGSIYMLSILSLLLLFWREYMEIYGAQRYYDLPYWISLCIFINFVFLVDLTFKFL